MAIRREVIPLDHIFSINGDRRVLVQLQPGTFTHSMASLFNKGLRFSTVIDIGCADGHFFLDHFDMGLLPNAVAVNIDANPLYESSLRDIKDVLGGHYLVAAISD